MRPVLLVLAMILCGCGDAPRDPGSERSALPTPGHEDGSALKEALSLARAGVAPSSRMSPARLRNLRSAMSATWDGDIVSDLDFVASKIRRALKEIPREEVEDLSRLGGQWTSFRRTLINTLEMLEKGDHGAARDMIHVFRRAPDGDAGVR